DLDGRIVTASLAPGRRPVMDRRRPRPLPRLRRLACGLCAAGLPLLGCTPDASFVNDAAPPPPAQVAPGAEPGQKLPPPPEAQPAPANVPPLSPDTPLRLP